MEKCNFMEWKNKLVKTIQGDEGGPVASNLRREGVCFNVEPAKNNIRHNFFLNRIIPVWNKLPGNIKQAKTINSLKSLLDKQKSI